MQASTDDGRLKLVRDLSRRGEYLCAELKLFAFLINHETVGIFTSFAINFYNRVTVDTNRIFIDEKLFTLNCYPFG